MTPTTVAFALSNHNNISLSNHNSFHSSSGCCRLRVWESITCYNSEWALSCNFCSGEQLLSSFGSKRTMTTNNHCNEYQTLFFFSFYLLFCSFFVLFYLFWPPLSLEEKLGYQTLLFRAKIGRKA